MVVFLKKYSLSIVIFVTVVIITVVIKYEIL